MTRWSSWPVAVVDPAYYNVRVKIGVDLETTMTGSHTFEQALAQGRALGTNARVIDVAQMRRQGYLSIE